MLKFWVKRVLRIYPAFAVCVILCAVAGYFISGLPMAEYLPGAKVYVTENLLMRPLFNLPGVFAGNPYGMYLWAFPVQQMVLFLFRNRTMPPVLILFLISAGITLLLAMLTGKFVEEPVKKITAVFLK